MITVIGSINLDLIATVDRLPEAGETVPGSSFRTAPGGKGANQALAARRAGSAVRFVGAVGRDSFAPQALELLGGGGVELSLVGETAEPTGTALILVDANGENMIAVVPGANGTIDQSRLAELSFVAGGHVLLQQEIPLDTVEAALAAIRHAGGVSMLNIAPFHASAARFAGSADYLVANETEFDLYAEAIGLKGETREERMRNFVATTGHIVIVTLGPDGVQAATPYGFLMVASLKIEPIDTVGAGDTFCGYLAASLERGLSLTEALHRAAVAGAIACLKPGAQPAIPTSAEVAARL